MSLPNYFKQLTCKHEWRFIGELSTPRRVWHIRVYHCRKCGKFREEQVVEDPEDE